MNFMRLCLDSYSLQLLGKRKDMKVPMKVSQDSALLRAVIRRLSPGVWRYKQPLNSDEGTLKQHPIGQFCGMWYGDCIIRSNYERMRSTDSKHDASSSKSAAKALKLCSNPSQLSPRSHIGPLSVPGKPASHSSVRGR